MLKKTANFNKRIIVVSVSYFLENDLLSCMCRIICRVRIHTS